MGHSRCFLAGVLAGQHVLSKNRPYDKLTTVKETWFHGFGLVRIVIVVIVLLVVIEILVMIIIAIILQIVILVTVIIPGSTCRSPLLPYSCRLRLVSCGILSSFHPFSKFRLQGLGLQSPFSR